MTQTGYFSGYAAVFARADAGRDIIFPGAFSRALAAVKSLPLLWQHEAQMPIGRTVDLVQDSQGLKVFGALTLNAAQGQNAWALMQTGVLTGLSIGYRVKRAEMDRRANIRRLIDLDLVEISLVTFPMQTHARVTHVSAVA